MSQPLLFPARKTDPPTSREAAVKVIASGIRARQQQRVADAVRAFPGLTSAELARLPGIGLNRYQIARRLPECGDIRKGKIRKCRVTGNNAVTWIPITNESNA